MEECVSLPALLSAVDARLLAVQPWTLFTNSGECFLGDVEPLAYFLEERLHFSGEVPRGEKML